MEKINIAELLKDCPKGMELDCTIFDGVKFDGIEAGIYPIRITIPYVGVMNLNKFGEHFMFTKNTKCVIYPKGKTTWESFHRPFKDGDIIFTRTGNYNWVSIFKQFSGNSCCTHIDLCINDNDLFPSRSLCNIEDITTQRIATAEEKQKLFLAITDNGYKWNSETKTLEKFSKFKNGDVIVCENHWGPFISIFKENVTERNGFIGHCVLDMDDNEFKVKDSASYFNKARFATKREKEQLFRAIEKNGYKWNQETKILEKLLKFKVGDRIRHKCPEFRGERIVNICCDTGYFTTINDWIDIAHQDDWELVPNKFNINTLVPFESKVLVRNDEQQYWIPAFWGCKRADGYTTTFGWCKYCIPYEGNEHLLETNKDCDEHFKTWK